MSEGGAEPTYQTVPLSGVVIDSQIELVPSHQVQYWTHVLGAVVGAIGSIVLGTGIAPLVSPPTSLPTSATRAMAQECITTEAGCKALAMSSSPGTMVTVLTVVGGLLMVLQVVLLIFVRPKKRLLLPVPKAGTVVSQPA